MFDFFVIFVFICVTAVVKKNKKKTTETLYNVIKHTTNSANTIVYHIKQSGRPSKPWNTKILDGISQFYEFQYDKNNICIFKFSEIGNGKNITIDTTVVEQYKAYWKSIVETTQILNTSTQTYNSIKVSQLQKPTVNQTNNNSTFSQRFLALESRKEKVYFPFFVCKSCAKHKYKNK